MGILTFLAAHLLVGCFAFLNCAFYQLSIFFNIKTVTLFLFIFWFFLKARLTIFFSLTYDVLSFILFFLYFFNTFYDFLFKGNKIVFSCDSFGITLGILYQAITCFRKIFNFDIADFLSLHGLQPHGNIPEHTSIVGDHTLSRLSPPESLNDRRLLVQFLQRNPLYFVQISYQLKPFPYK